MGNTLTFRTTTQAILFEHEIRGQLSDGQWENASPRDHWQPWCRADIRVGTRVGRSFPVRRDYYCLTSRDLLSVVEKRMLGYVRLGIAYGRDAVDALKYLVDCDGWEGMPTYDGEYWDKIRARIAVVLSGSSLEKAKAIAENTQGYTSQDLRADLREMARTMKTLVEDEAPSAVEQLEQAVAIPVAATTPVADAATVRQVAGALNSMSAYTDEQFARLMTIDRGTALRNLAKLLLCQA